MDVEPGLDRAGWGGASDSAVQTLKKGVGDLPTWMEGLKAEMEMEGPMVGGK